jgi:hypothetical protein
MKRKRCYRILPPGWVHMVVLAHHLLRTLNIPAWMQKCPYVLTKWASMATIKMEPNMG